MSAQNYFPRPLQTTALLILALGGAAIGFGLMLLFLSGVDVPDPAWPDNWRLRPLVVISLAGAAAGTFIYFLHYYLGYEGGWKKIITVVIGALGFIIALWLGAVLGLDGTLWN